MPKFFEALGRLAPTLAVLCVMLALGCKPAEYGYASAPGSSDGYGGEYGAYEESEASYDMVAMGASAPAPAREQRARFKDAKQDAEMPASVADTSTTVPESEPAEPALAPPSDEQQPAANHGRQIIYSAGMGLSVFDVEDVMAKLEAIPERHGGWLEQRYDNSMVLRVPAAKLRSIMAEVGEWGVVDWKTLQALDVTAEYTDLDARIRVLEQMQKHLQALLGRAKNVEESLAIQVELTKVTAELEVLRAQMRMLASSIAFSTLAVQLTERGTVQVEVGNDPFLWVDELGAEATAYQ